MSHKIIKPDLDLVFARIAIFGMLASLFAVSYVNGHPSWLTWVVMLLGVFSIFEAAIKADEVLGRVIDSQSVIEDLTKRVIIQHRIIKYQDQKIDQLIELRGKEIKELRASYHGEMIGHEVHLKNIKQERDELQTLYTQQSINMLKLQKRVDGALKETQYALQYVEGDMRGNHEFLQMAMIRTFKALEQVLNGGEA
ncbi:Uncharacterised protein [Acinetobacter baumannii]|uniref:hypothetical protein n=1 Tax=Acinetobacter baumannii TaxID=470 RepID=UPI000DE5E5EF|nr:hypothetical protein [Acinetobacter baumannii]SSQ26987.1 Uncharacterised protein [Acinetobacter baumannii]